MRPRRPSIAAICPGRLPTKRRRRGHPGPVRDVANKDSLLAESYRSRSVGILARAVARGLIATPEILNNDAFISLRNRDDFRGLRERLDDKRRRATMGGQTVSPG